MNFSKKGTELSTSTDLPWKFLHFVTLFVFAEGKLNRYAEKIKAAMEFISRNETLVEMYKEHIRKHQHAMVSNIYNIFINANTQVRIEILSN